MVTVESQPCCDFAKLSALDLTTKCVRLRNQWQKWKAATFGTECWGYWQVDVENTYLTTFWASASKCRSLRMAFKIKAKIQIISAANRYINIQGLLLMILWWTHTGAHEWKLCQIKTSDSSACWKQSGKPVHSWMEVRQNSGCLQYCIWDAVLGCNVLTPVVPVLW